MLDLQQCRASDFSRRERAAAGVHEALECAVPRFEFGGEAIVEDDGLGGLLPAGEVAVGHVHGGEEAV